MNRSQLREIVAVAFASDRDGNLEIYKTALV
jgi:hypothetical protein